MIWYNEEDKALINYVKKLKRELKEITGECHEVGNMPMNKRWRYWRDKAVLLQGITQIQERRIRRLEHALNPKRTTKFK
jgi:hypothetical protein